MPERRLVVAPAADRGLAPGVATPIDLALSGVLLVHSLDESFVGRTGFAMSGHIPETTTLTIGTAVAYRYCNELL